MSITQTIISWLHLHMDEKYFSTLELAYISCYFPELVPWQLKVGEENHTIELTSFLLISYFKHPIGIS